jgi:hypothetical protein
MSWRTSAASTFCDRLPEAKESREPTCLFASAVIVADDAVSILAADAERYPLRITVLSDQVCS